MIGAPAAWAIQLDVGYALPEALCRLGSSLPLHLLTLGCALYAGISSVMCYSEYRLANDQSIDATDGGKKARLRFVGALGLIVSLLFFVVIIAQGLAGLFFESCWS